MAEQEYETFEGTGETAEKNLPNPAGEVKKGMTVLLKGFPCKVIEVTTSKTGKHGHAKANITGLDIFTGKKYQDISPTSHNMVAPVVNNNNLTLTDISEEGYCTLMDDNGEIREDLKIPDENSPDKELGANIRAALDSGDKEVVVVITKAMDSEVITGFKLAAE
eukprot:CAMPEP_0204825406 /NCGR_PEP_ID=MMETSP1346-20131115/3300_1 /ASSEMBLY_ACC=CAM_ASM_000771 /TAXON_ID=215587 /ORGANISM="Aplanochytrium stocchinoi, Strain GSBS06" /LENGTH=163 /DNA_ID=CAMNT_0051953035 /DNA_START=41 /DNA_END=533 /DNA_ORIENTATION=+